LKLQHPNVREAHLKYVLMKRFTAHVSFLTTLKIQLTNMTKSKKYGYIIRSTGRVAKSTSLSISLSLHKSTPRKYKKFINMLLGAYN
jgi:hypothetical protein